MARIRTWKNKNGEITSYQIRIFKGKDSDGKELRPFIKNVKPFPDTWSEEKQQKELQKIAILFEKECKEGIIADNKQTFEKYAQYVIALKERNGIKHRTIDGYRKLLKRIIPELGYLKLADIRPQHLNIFYEKLSYQGANLRTGGKLTTKTILEYHRFIATILVQAEKELLIQFNVASKATPPRVKNKEADFLEIDDIKNILLFLENEPLKWQIALQLLIFSGCRRGEIWGLQWDKINFKNHEININKNLLYTRTRGVFEDTVKTEKSKRRLTMPANFFELLKEYRKEYLKMKLVSGEKWYDTNFLFVRDNGKPMSPDSLTKYCITFRKKYNKIIKKENKEKGKDLKLLPRMNPHIFRHSQASILFFNGADAITISKRLGHARVSTTTDIYSHIMQKADRSASDTLAKIFANKNSEVG